MSAPELYHASQIKRRRRTKGQVEQLDRQIIDVLRADHPQSVRHVFYRVTDPRLAEPVEKTDHGYQQVQSRLVKLRRDGAVPYGWLADMSRRGYFVNTFSDAGEFIFAMQSLYRGDLWRHSEHYCEVWCESRSIASVIQKDCKELAVSLYPCGGFSSISFVHDAVEEINARKDQKPVTVFYIGDYDPAGVLIDVALEREMRLHLKDGVDFRFVRLGITEEQIKQHDLPEKPRKATDKRAIHIERTVEAEAMPAGVLRQILRDALEALLPPNALKVCRVAEKSERMRLVELAEEYEHRWYFRRSGIMTLAANPRTRCAPVRGPQVRTCNHETPGKPTFRDAPRCELRTLKKSYGTRDNSGAAVPAPGGWLGRTP